MKSILVLSVLAAYASAAALHVPRQTDGYTESSSIPTITPSATSVVEVTSTPATTTSCFIDIIGNPQKSFNDSGTCTLYANTVTETSYTDCGGCSINTIFLGPGPEVQCSTWTTIDVTTTTVAACSPTS